MSLLVQDVMNLAMRMIGALAAGDTMTAQDAADVFLAFNTLKRSWFGTLIGPRLSAQYLSGASGQAENGGEYSVPAGAAFTLTAPLNPRSGARFGVVDSALDFGSYALTIAPNGRQIAGSTSSLVLSTSGSGARFWYRGDTGNWIQEADFASYTSAIEWPDTIVDLMPYMLALVIAPEFNTELRADVIAGDAMGRRMMAQSYGRRGRGQLEPPIGVPQAAAPAQPGQG